MLPGRSYMKFHLIFNSLEHHVDVAQWFHTLRSTIKHLLPKSNVSFFLSLGTVVVLKYCTCINWLMDGHPFEFFTEQHCCFFLADDCIKGRAEACQPHPREKFLVMETPFKKSIRYINLLQDLLLLLLLLLFCRAGQGWAGQARRRSFLLYRWLPQHHWERLLLLY